MASSYKALGKSARSFSFIFFNVYKCLSMNLLWLSVNNELSLSNLFIKTNADYLARSFASD